MTAQKRFLIGGLGAIMPVLITLTTLDITGVWSLPNMLGIAFRYIIFFIVGGIVCYLHADESKPFKLFQLGIAAPALMSSLISVQNVSAAPTAPENQKVQIEFSILSSAYAQTDKRASAEKRESSFLNEVFSGLTGKVYRDARKKSESKSGSEKKTTKTTKPSK